MEQPDDTGRRWQRRPVASAAVRVAVFLVPVAAAVVVAIALSRALPAPDGGLQTLLWWSSVWTGSTATLLILERLARRFLPLASLLNLSLLFPSKAPRRMALARRVGTVRQLEQRLAEARQHGIEDDAAKAAESILTLVAALQLHDRRTRGHAERVRVFTDLLVEEMGLPHADRDRLRWAALLHDIGKLAVSADLLNKPDRLSEDEWHTIQRHPEAGARYCGPLLEWLGQWGNTIAQHHERWDGGGYPKGLAGDDICLGARIVAVPDAYEVMTSARAYKLPVSAQAARDELARQAGSQFDPAVVRAFLNLSIRRLRWVMGPAAWLAQLPFVANSPQLASTGAFSAAAAATVVAALSLVGGGADPAVGGPRIPGEVAYGASVPAGAPGVIGENPATSGAAHLDDLGRPAAPPAQDLAAGSAPQRTAPAGSGGGLVDADTTSPAPTVRREAPERRRDRPVATTPSGGRDKGPTADGPASTDGSGGDTTVEQPAKASPPESEPELADPPRRDRASDRRRDRRPERTPRQSPVTASNDTATVAPGGTVTVPVLRNDRGDLVVSTLHLSSAVGRGNGTATVADGAITFTDGRSAVSTHKVRYRVCDAAGNCDRAILTINVVGDRKASVRDVFAATRLALRALL